MKHDPMPGGGFTPGFVYDPGDPLGKRKHNKHQPKKRAQAKPSRTARVNKNLVNSGLGPAVMKYGLTGRALRLFLGLVYLAQRQRSPRLTFRSWRDLLIELGWDQKRGDDYATLRGELRRLKAVHLHFKHFHAKGKGKERNVSFPVFKTLRRTFEGLTVELSPELWAHHRPEARRYFVLADLEKIARLRYAPEILLGLYIGSWNRGHQRPLRDFGAVLGIVFHSRECTRARIRKAMEAVARELGEAAMPEVAVREDVFVFKPTRREHGARTEHSEGRLERSLGEGPCYRLDERGYERRPVRVDDGGEE